MAEMRYFAYCSVNQSVVTTYDIFDTVRSLSAYAKTIYKSHWEEALDNALFHILNNYNEESGDLLHYATRVVGTILLNKYSKEVTHEIALENGMESKSIADGDSDLAEGYVNKQEVLARSNVKECVKLMVPKFVGDFSLFQTGKSNKRNHSYSDIFEKFDLDTIKESKDYLVNEYEGTILRLKDTASKCTIRKISEMRIDKAKDDTIDYQSMINDIVIYRKWKNQHTKLFYMVDIKETLTKILKQMYETDTGYFNHVIIEDHDVYVSLSGDIVVGEKNLLDTLEFELLCTLIKSVVSFKIVDHIKGEKLLLSSSKEVPDTFTLESFGTSIDIDLQQKTSKRYQQ